MNFQTYFGFPTYCPTCENLFVANLFEEPIRVLFPTIFSWKRGGIEGKGNMGGSLEILKALDFAAHRHRNQRRKDEEKTPYINHPITVAKTLAQEGGVTDPTVLIAAIIHDTIEDTGTTAEEVEEHFGGEVRAIVEEVSDDKSLDWMERKQLQIRHASSISTPAKMIKVADKICNIGDIITNPPAWPHDRKLTYLGWAEQVFEGCRGANHDLEVVFDETVRWARAALEESRKKKNILGNTPKREDEGGSR